ncbi:MFS transporter [Paenibacillus filicis]|uniref:MFS transporter n=1 Tax=Paenibacillus filicis TaxID=669464 RepID=A0ABU9DGF0_9BACL
MNLRSRIALLSLSVTATFGTMMAAPALKLLAVAYPTVSPLLIQWVVTLSSLFILPTLFLSGPLGKRFPRKNILITGLLLYLIGGIGPAFSDSFTVILVFRAILGLSIGLISPTFNTLIAESFQGEERTRMNGFVTSTTGIGGAVFLSLGGLIASFGWRYVFMTYIFAIVLLLLVVLFLPKFPPAPRVERAAGAPASKLPFFFYPVIVAAGLHTMLFFLIPTNLSVFLTDNGIGSVASSGYFSALALIGVFVGGLAVPYLVRRFQSLLVPLLLALMAAGFVFLSSTHSLLTTGIAVLLVGFAEGSLFPLSFSKTASTAGASSLAFGISLLLACVYTFQFISPLFMQAVVAVFHLSSTREFFMAMAVGLAVATVAYTLVTQVRKAKPATSR